MPKTWFEWFTIVQAIATLAALVLLATLRFGAKAGTTLKEHEDQSEEIEKIKQRLDAAGKRQSDLADRMQPFEDRLRQQERRGHEDHERLRALNEYVNALPLRLTDQFLPRREADLIMNESKTDRQRLHDEQDRLWKVVQNIRERHKQ